jgi:dihydrofolate synthase/folylpolyglutamate synthase
VNYWEINTLEICLPRGLFIHATTINMKLQAWLDLLEKRHPSEIDLGLERCGSVYHALGSPKPAKNVFTVAGTNGKGSTVAYLAAMSGALGQRYGSYTSPHIFRYNERINIMGEPVSDDCLVRAFEQVEAARQGVSLTYFEFTTLAAFVIMHQSELDCAVLEVGLGGRLDTVNLVDTDCALITPIGLDHQDYLGSDLFSIARVKAGIIRAGSAVVCTEQSPPLPILQTAEQLGAPVHLRNVDYELVQHTPTGADTSLMKFSMGEQSMLLSPPSMSGKHQLDNLAAALAALVLLNPGCSAMEDELSEAIRHCKVPGRLQLAYTSPEFILDVGHNELAAQAVADFLEQNKHMDTICVLAMLADKPAESVAFALGGVCKRWLCADSPGSRGQTGELLAQRVQMALPSADVSFFGPLENALSEALANADKNSPILVFGSFTTVATAADWLQNSMQHGGHDAAKITAHESGTYRRDNLNG